MAGATGFGFNTTIPTQSIIEPIKIKASAIIYIGTSVPATPCMGPPKNNINAPIDKSRERFFRNSFLFLKNSNKNIKKKNPKEERLPTPPKTPTIGLSRYKVIPVSWSIYGESGYNIKTTMAIAPINNIPKNRGHFSDGYFNAEGTNEAKAMCR